MCRDVPLCCGEDGGSYLYTVSASIYFSCPAKDNSSQTNTDELCKLIVDASNGHPTSSARLLSSIELLSSSLLAIIHMASATSA